MNGKIKNKVNTLVKSMYKSVKKASAKDVIADVMDSDRTAEIGPDDIPKPRIGALNKAKNKAKKKAKETDMDKCACVEDCDCECDSPVEKGEKFIKDFMAGFEKISKAYLAKDVKGFGEMIGGGTTENPTIKPPTPPAPSSDSGSWFGNSEEDDVERRKGKPKTPSDRKVKSKDKGPVEEKRKEKRVRGRDKLPKIPTILRSEDSSLEKAKIDQGISNTDKKNARKERNEDYQSNRRSSKDKIKRYLSDPKRRKNDQRQDSRKNDLTAKYGKKPSKEDLEYPMASSEKS